ncbi:MAG TPA: hypothetical protein VIG08_07570 [Gemmatimonadales bacterium]|jgi:hypothetical protein
MLLGSVALVGCNRDRAPEPPKFGEVMPNVPLPPQATFVSRSGGAEALQITVRSPARADVVAKYYRDLFKKQGWRLVNDAKDSEGAVVLFVEQNGPPLWVRIRNADDGRGTFVDLAGARLERKSDSIPAPQAPAAKPTS